ncbi:NAD(P)/FAD-dependent oxidoreductase [Myxococcaceae bacterium GXIMD 01537]
MAPGAAKQTVIIGGGHAGLMLSYWLTRRSLPHVVLERGRVGERWRSERWDSFRMVTPAWMLGLPGLPLEGVEPEAFLPRDAFISYLERWAAHFEPPVRTGVHVDSVRAGPSGGFLVQTREEVLEAAQVVVATGSAPEVRIPECASALPPEIHQLHTRQYRNPGALPPGGVLVVGSGQSGCQIAEELLRSGRQVWLSLGSSGRLPRSYRGRDSTWWRNQMGGLDTSAERLPSPRERFASSPHLGDHTLSLHELAREGVRLLGRLRGVEGGRALFANDVRQRVVRADLFEASFRAEVDAFIKLKRLEAAPPEPTSPGKEGSRVEVVPEVDLRAAGVGTVLWATGFSFDFRWIDLPVFDETGFPLHERGGTRVPGLYFLGLPWLHKSKSSLVFGASEDAQHLAEAIATAA